MQNVHNRLGILFILFFLIHQTVLSQDENDFETWSSIGVEYKVNKRLSLGLEEQLRLENNSSEIDAYFTQFSTSYKVWGNFSLGGGLRYINKNDNQGKIQGYENHFRYQIDAGYKHKLNKFSLKYRFRYQNKNELGVSVEEGDEVKQYLRFKTALGYNISDWKLDPKLSFEVYKQLDVEGDGFNKLRWTLSTGYKFKKMGELKLFYRIEKELNVSIPSTISILGLKYVYAIANKK